MARIRSVHPGQTKDEAFVECSPWARLLAIFIRNHADDQGVFEWKPKTLKMEIFPADDVDVPALLAELEATNQVKRFEDSGRAYGVIRNFTKYQKPKTPNAIHPLPESIKLWRDNFGTTSETLPKSSGTTSEKPFQMEEGGGSLKEEDGKKVTAASQLTAVPSMGTPLDFKKAVFSSGVAYLTACGLRERDARSMLGKWRRDHGDAVILMAMAQADGAAVSEPIPYIQAVLSKRATTNGSGNSGQFGAADHHLGQFGALIEKYKLEEGDEGSNCH